MAKLLYQGHGSYRFTTNGGTVIYLDPYAGEGYDVPADLILCTHEHGDHTAFDKMPHAEGFELYRAKDFQPSPGKYVTIESHGIATMPVQAYNKFHPIDECVGLVIIIDGKSFYAPGDTSITEDVESGKLAALELDYTAVPIDGFFTMDLPEAARFAELVDAKHTIPVHMVPVNDMANPEIFSAERAEALDVANKIILEPGQEIDL